MFMVRKDVWLLIADKDVFLCIGCTERRLGRPISFEDLIDCPLNSEILLGARLAWRLLLTNP